MDMPSVMMEMPLGNSLMVENHGGGDADNSPHGSLDTLININSEKEITEQQIDHEAGDASSQSQRKSSTSPTMPTTFSHLGPIRRSPDLAMELLASQLPPPKASTTLMAALSGQERSGSKEGESALHVDEGVEARVGAHLQPHPEDGVEMGPQSASSSESIQGPVEPKTNLIVNYLPQTLNDDEFRLMFTSIGPIYSCRIMRDKRTGYSFGYGFVNYVKTQDATQAIATLNGKNIQNKQIKVALARPSGEDIKHANLYVKGISKDMTRNELTALFQPYGEIIQSKILVDQYTGYSKGAGFVLYSRRSEADAAIQALHNTKPPGFADFLSVKRAKDEGTEKSMVHHVIHHYQYPQNSTSYPFMNDMLMQNYSNGSVRSEMMEPVIGNPMGMNSLSPMNGPIGGGGYGTGYGLGFSSGINGMVSGMSNGLGSMGNGMGTGMSNGMVGNNGARVNNSYYGSRSVQPTLKLRSPNPYSLASHSYPPPITALNNGQAQDFLTHHLSSMSLGSQGSGSYGSTANSLGSSNSDQGPSDGVTEVLFVYNIGNADEKTLWSLFQPYGDITKVNVIRDHGKGGVGKGFGFVTMGNAEQARCAIEKLNGYMLNNRQIQVSPKK